MSYLDKRKWKDTKFLQDLKGGLAKHTKAGRSRRGGGHKIVFALLGLIVLAHVIPLLLGGKKGDYVFEEYLGSVTEVEALRLKKPLDLFINRKVTDTFDEPYPLGDSLSVLRTGEGAAIGSNLDAITFTFLNSAKQYLGRNAIGWIWPSLEFKKLKLARMEAEMERIEMGKGTKFAGQNWAMAFEVVPYVEFSGVVKNAPSSESVFMAEPYFFKKSGMEGFDGFDRMFGDGKVRQIDPKDNWVALRANTHGLFRRNHEVPSLAPSRVLPTAFYLFTDLCDLETGQWETERTQWLVARQYAFAYGVYIDHRQIEIVGLGMDARFLFHGEMPEEIYSHWHRGQRRGEKGNLMNVPLVTRVDARPGSSDVKYENELCFYGSTRADQSIFIPFFDLRKWSDDDAIILLEGQIVTNFGEILDECQVARENSRGRRKELRFSSGSGNRYQSSDSIPMGADFSSCVVKTPRLTEIANRAIGNATTRREALVSLADLTAHLKYTSDFHKPLDDGNYRGPREVYRTALVAFLNWGDDCEGHATVLASFIRSATHLAMGGNNNVGLSRLTYYGIGHVITLIPNIGIEAITNPFPNHVVLEDLNGKKVPFFTVEATGNGDNETHSISPDKNGYRTLAAIVIGSPEGWQGYSSLGFVH